MTKQLQASANPYDTLSGERVTMLSPTLFAVRATPLPETLEQFVTSEVGSRHRLCIGGLARRSGGILASLAIAIDFKCSRVTTLDVRGTIVEEIPDDALTNVQFYEDNTGNCHFVRWNPFAPRPPFQPEYAKLISAAMLHHPLLRKRNLISEELGRSYRPLSLFIQPVPLRDWFRSVCEARQAVLTRYLTEVVEAGRGDNWIQRRAA